LLSLVRAQSTLGPVLATGDTTIYSESPTFSNSAGSYLFTGFKSGNERRALIEFSLANYATQLQGATITGVTLYLYQNDATSTTSSAIQVLPVSALWTEPGVGSKADSLSSDGSDGTTAVSGDATWKYSYYSVLSWLSQGGDYAATASATVNVAGQGWYQVSSPALITDVQGWLSSSSSNNGWILVSALNAPLKQFLSKNNGLSPLSVDQTSSASCYLSITYTGGSGATPTPPAANGGKPIAHIDYTGGGTPGTGPALDATVTAGAIVYIVAAVIPGVVILISVVIIVTLRLMRARRGY